MTAQDLSSQTGTVVVHDGDCPVCSQFAKLIRLRATAVTLFDARKDTHPAVALCVAAGFDLDAGMAVAVGGKFDHGDAAMVVLASLTTPMGLFNRLNAWMFRPSRRARRLYPVLVGGRNLSLRLMGRRRIGRV